MCTQTLVVLVVQPSLQCLHLQNGLCLQQEDNHLDYSIVSGNVYILYVTLNVCYRKIFQNATVWQANSLINNFFLHKIAIFRPFKVLNISFGCSKKCFMETFF